MLAAWQVGGVFWSVLWFSADARSALLAHATMGTLVPAGLLAVAVSSGVLVAAW